MAMEDDGLLPENYNVEGMEPVDPKDPSLPTNLQPVPKQLSPFEEIEKLVGELTERYLVLDTEVNLLQEKDDELTKMINDLVKARQEVREVQDETRRERNRVRQRISNLTADMQRAKAEEEAKKALEPHLDDPRLQAMIETLKLHPRANDLAAFQWEDIVFHLDRKLFPQPTTGILNGNDTGLGKTAETACFLWSIEKADKDGLWDKVKRAEAKNGDD